MRATFEVAYDVLHDHEKGIVTAEKARRIGDEGGATKDGVSLRYLREKGFDVDGDGKIDAADVMALTPEQIKYVCMKQDFWLAIWEQLDQMTATKMLDMAVNIGVVPAVRIAQFAANSCGVSPPLEVDGVFGPVTTTAVNSLRPEVFVRECGWLQRNYYVAILQRRPGMEPCRAGWMARAAWPFDPRVV